MRTTDNNCGKPLSDFENIADLACIANKKLLYLQKENPHLLIFPHSFGEYHDDVEKSPIFSLEENKLTTYNLMGFIGRNDSQLTIASRFAKDDENDYFLHYMLQKVFSINLLDVDQTPNKENIWDFLLYLFPYYLKKAYTQGLYKAYRKTAYNDANIKGAIDVKRHILKNIPFSGKVAYNTREYSHDNDLTQLIRHTIEHIKTHRFGRGVLTNDSEVRDIVSKFVFATQNTYSKNARQKTIAANFKPVSHPYFTEYTMLQKICLQILRQEKITFGTEKDRVYGLLFDGAWLWEEYLYTVLKRCGFEHPENKKETGAIYLFDNPKRYPRYPDFLKPNFILDAKYKHLPNYIDRNDMHQIISYMYVTKSNKGGFIYPVANSDKVADINKMVEYEEIGVLKGFGGNIATWSLAIPQTAANFQQFIATMNENEGELQKILTELSDS